MVFVLTAPRIKMLQLINNGMVEEPSNIEDFIVIQDLCLAGLTRKNHYTDTYTVTNAGAEILRIYHSTQQSVSEALGGFECSESFLALSEALRKAGAPRSGQRPPIRNPAPQVDVYKNQTVGKSESGYVNVGITLHEFAESMKNTPYEPAELQELRTVARQLAVEHQLQDDATPVQVMIILSNLLKSSNAFLRKLEKLPSNRPAGAKWKIGDTVQKKQGPQHWRGKVVGYYSTEKTPIGYSVESAFEKGSVQVWPEAALIEWFDHTASVGAFGEAAAPSTQEPPMVKMESTDKHGILAEACALAGHGNRIRSGNYIVCEKCRTVL